MLALGAVAALVLAFVALFFSVLLLGFSFDAPGSHFMDSGLWFRLLILWPPLSLVLVALAAVTSIFRKSLRLLWIALGLLAGTIVAMTIAVSIFS